MVGRYGRQHHQHVAPDLNELLYVVVRLAVSIASDPNFAGTWSDVVRDVRRRLQDHLPQGIGYRERHEPIVSGPAVR